MARAKRESDNVYNARYEAQARDATMKAAQLYTKGQKPQGQIKALMERQGIADRLRALGGGEDA